MDARISVGVGSQSTPIVTPPRPDFFNHVQRDIAGACSSVTPAPSYSPGHVNQRSTAWLMLLFQEVLGLERDINSRGVPRGYCVDVQSDSSSARCNAQRGIRGGDGRATLSNGQPPPCEQRQILARACLFGRGTTLNAS